MNTRELALKQFALETLGTLKTLIDSGLSVETSYDLVFGEGAYSKLAAELYTELRNTNRELLQ